MVQQIKVFIIPADGYYGDWRSEGHLNELSWLPIKGERITDPGNIPSSAGFKPFLFPSPSFLDIDEMPRSGLSGA